MSKALKIIFLGTPDFAAASLRKLVENGIQIVAVVTAPDKPMGRGKKVGTSAVKDYSLEVGLPILQPTNLKDSSFLKELKSFQADLQIVVAFRMLPEAVWNMPPLGTFNLHASLLPQYRGAAPINWAIINGEKETGVTTFFLKHEIDTGEIIYQEKEPIHVHDNVGTLYERLMQKGADLVLKTTQAIQAGNYPQTPQKVTEDLKPAPKIFREDCKINWDQPAQKVHDFVRGMSPYPAAWTILHNKTLKIFKTEITDDLPLDQVANYTIYEGNLYFQAADGWLKVVELQIEGKRRMKTEEFLRGFKG
ncbi:MAG: methionyl-tRNA formyltransferase [Ekhidna sp.]